MSRPISPETQEILKAAVRLAKSDAFSVEDIVTSVYMLGRLDGAMSQLDRDEEMVRERLQETRQ
jgi:hypothetical protein